MSLLTPEGAVEATAGGGVSRRHILQGVAWATPAVLIATAAPAAASSVDPEIVPTEPGGLVVASTSAVYGSSLLTVKGQVAFAGTAAGAPVEGLTATVTFTGSSIDGQTPTNVAAGWTFLTAVTPNYGGTWIYTFRYDGEDLSASNETAFPFSAGFPGWRTWGGPVAVAAAGASYGVAVSANATATATQMPNLVFNPLGTSGTQGGYNAYFAVRHNGPQNPNAAAATNLVVEATYDTGQMSAPTQATIGPWALTVLPAVGTTGRVRFTYQPGTLALGATAAQIAVRFPAVGSVGPASVTFTGTFASIGNAGTVSNGGTISWN